MRLRLLLVFLALAAILRAATPAPLAEALETGVDDFDCWAYTQTEQNVDAKGSIHGARSIRFDPSKPYAEQYVPLSIDGKPPTDAQKEDYRRRGEKRGKHLEEIAQKAKNPGDDKGTININGQMAKFDFEHAAIKSETPASITYLVPLLPKGDNPLPVEKIRLTVQVGKAHHVLEHAEFTLLASYRFKVVAKLNAGTFAMDWQTVSPDFRPVTSGQKITYAASVLFVKFAGTQTTVRTDIQRVKPYSARFGVHIGPLKNLSF